MNKNKTEMLWVIIPSWNRKEKVATCIQSVLEVFDVTGIIVVWNEKPTAFARNKGIERIPDDSLVLSLDDDIEMMLQFKPQVPILLKKARDKRVGIVQISRAMKGKKFKEGNFCADALCGTGGGFLFRKEIWKEVGGFPPDYLDDITFSANVYAAGYTNYRTTHMYAKHDAGNKTGGMYEVLKKFGPDSYYPCLPEKYGVTGNSRSSKDGMRPNITNPRVVKDLREKHKRAKEQRLL